MKKSGPDASLFAMPIPGMDMQAMMESCGNMTAKMEDLGRTMIGSMQRTVDSTWDLTAQLARSDSPGEAARLYRQWLDERRDAFLAEGRQVSALWFGLCDARPMAAAGGGTPTSGLPRAASAAE